MTTGFTLFTIVLYNNRSSRYMSVLLSYILISHHGLDLSFIQLVHSFVSIIDGAENEIVYTILLRCSSCCQDKQI